MQSIAQLRNMLVALPSRFARASDDAPAGKTDERMNFEEGFPLAYSCDPEESDSSESDASEVIEGRYLLRDDFNRFGEMSSRESMFKETGGVHTFSQDTAKAAGGYPERALLSAYDGVYLAKVESTESGNNKAFTDPETDEVVPGVIDCAVKDDDDSDPNAEERVLWRTAGWVYGVNEGLFNLELDYTRTQILPPEGGVIAADSVVIGIDVAILTGYGNSSYSVLPPTSYETHITSQQTTNPLKFTNKGHTGCLLGYIYIPWITELSNGSLLPFFKQVPCMRVTGGTGNYALSFFAKGGTQFSGMRHAYVGKEDVLNKAIYTDRFFDPYINWIAIPFKPVVRTGEEEE